MICQTEKLKYCGGRVMDAHPPPDGAEFIRRIYIDAASIAKSQLSYLYGGF